MKSILFLMAAFLSGSRTGVGQTATDDFANLPSLISQLRQLQHSIRPRSAPGLLSALPSAWRVQTLDGDYSISTAPLRALLNNSNLNNAQPNLAISEAEVWLDHLALQLEGCCGPAPQSSEARDTLQRILARPEFAGDAPPNAWDRFRQRVTAWIVRWIERFPQLSREHPTSGQILFWFALIGAVAALGLWLVRLRHRRSNRLGLSFAPAPVTVRSWQHWLDAARAAADIQDIRMAIQCAYWAGVSRLQESGALPTGTPRTPREYLRLLSAPGQTRFGSRAGASAAAGTLGIVRLRALTSQLERFWYARGIPSAGDFSACLGSLEDLGCKVD